MAYQSNFQLESNCLTFQSCCGFCRAEVSPPQKPYSHIQKVMCPFARERYSGQTDHIPSELTGSWTSTKRCSWRWPPGWMGSQQDINTSLYPQFCVFSWKMGTQRHLVSFASNPRVCDPSLCSHPALAPVLPCSTKSHCLGSTFTEQ